MEAIGPSKGPENAPVTIVEFSDFQCPFCSKAKVTVDEVMKGYGDKVRLVFRHFPLSFHQDAPKAAEAAACANDQKKFWEYHDKLFANQGALEVDDLKKHAADLGLDTARFNECLDSGKKEELSRRTWRPARRSASAAPQPSSSTAWCCRARCRSRSSRPSSTRSLSKKK